MKKLLLIGLGFILLIVGCEEPSQHGCLDSQACNYDADATIDNNSCAYESDCAGECGGSAVVDECGVCGGDPSCPQLIDYANNHWDFGRWVHDYYKWSPEDAPNDFLGDEGFWDSIREVFVNRTDTLLYCHEPPYCYVDIWDHSHSIKFTYDGDIKSSNSNEFKNIFQELCGNEYTWDQKCMVEVIDLKDSNGDSILVVKDHNFYEGIGKYNMFTAGWDDTDSMYVITYANGSKVAMTPHELYYKALYSNP